MGFFYFFIIITFLFCFCTEYNLILKNSGQKHWSLCLPISSGLLRGLRRSSPTDTDMMRETLPNMELSMNYRPYQMLIMLGVKSRCSVGRNVCPPSLDYWSEPVMESTFSRSFQIAAEVQIVSSSFLWTCATQFVKCGSCPFITRWFLETTSLATHALLWCCAGLHSVVEIRWPDTGLHLSVSVWGKLSGSSTSAEWEREWYLCLSEYLSKRRIDLANHHQMDTGKNKPL